MAIHQYLRGALRIAFRLLEHGELIGIHWLELMDTGLDMPARKIAAIAAGERPSPKAAHGNALPVAVVDISRHTRHAWIFEGKPQRALPRGIWNAIAAECVRSR